NPAQALDKLVARMGGNIQDLANDAKALSATFNTDLNEAWVKAKLAVSPLTTDMMKLARDIQNSADQATLYHDKVKLYQDFRLQGLSAKEAQARIEAMTHEVFNNKKAEEALANSARGLTGDQRALSRQIENALLPDLK